VLDFGVKRGILRGLAARGLAVTVFPARTPAEELAGRFAGVVLSNGPGDPEPVTAGIAAARALLGRVPLLGICLGHQILGLALGGRTYKLRFGHHGGNHPVRDLRTGELWITAQNHGFAVDPQSLPPRAQATHVSLYDGTLEGFAVPEARALAVQFHPEASPGPSDGAPVLDRFAALVAGAPGE
jgi:carbamoyl-phosphate synthase small subunit